MNEVMYRYEISAQTLDYLLKVLDTRPHGEVRAVYDQLLRGKMEQDQEQREAPIVPTGNGRATPFQEMNSPG
jgi:hypothetical protein